MAAKSFKIFLRSGVLLIAVFYFLFFSTPIIAVLAQTNFEQPKAEIIFEGPDGPRSPGSEISVIVFIESTADTNAFSLSITYPTEILAFRSAETANSIINFWLQRPKELKSGLITLEGGIIGKTLRGRGEIVTLRFQAKAEGRGELKITESQVLLADGKGTPVQTLAHPKEITITAGAPTELSSVKDQSKPEIPFAEIIKNPIDKADILFFQIEERESGLVVSEVRFRRWFRWSPWQAAQNQIHAPSDAWQFEIRAVDNFGNESIKTLTRKDVLAKKTAASVISFLAAAGAVISILRRKIFAKKMVK
jgi:hypothetical protein